MTLILYAPSFDEESRQIRSALEEGTDVSGPEVLEGLDNLAARLREPVEDPAIAVLLVRGRTDIQELMSIEWLLKRVRIMLVLGEGDPETLSLAHRLRPRYLGYKDDDAHTIPAVINNMIQGFIKRTSTQGRR